MRLTKLFWISFLLLPATVGRVHAQTSTPQVAHKLTVTDGVSTQDLTFGLDPCASDGLDACVGEAGLPPLPPMGAFDTRFIGHDIGVPLDLGSWKDIRQGDSSTFGTFQHEISLQLGLGSIWTLSWDLPPNVTAVIQDFFGGVVLQEAVVGAGQLVITNAALNRLLFIVTYGPEGCAGSGGYVPALSVTSGIPVAGGQLTLRIDSGLGGAPALLFFGPDLGVIPMGNGCALNLSSLLPLVVPLPLGGSGAGGGSVSIGGILPPSAAGLSFACQAFVVDPVPQLGFSNSNGLKISVQ